MAETYLRTPCCPQLSSESHTDIMFQLVRISKVLDRFFIPGAPSSQLPDTAIPIIGPYHYTPSIANMADFEDEDTPADPYPATRN